MGRCTGTLGGASIGLTDGGTEVVIETNVFERFIDVYGPNTPIRSYDGGTRVTANFNLAEHAVDAYVQLVGFTTSSAKAVVGGTCGGVITTSALVLSAVDTSDPVAEITINEVYVRANGSVDFKNDSPRNIPVQAVGTIDSAESDGEMMAKFGAASTLPAISSVKIKDTANDVDEEAAMSTTADFDIKFDKQVYPAGGGTWATNGGAYIFLINVTDDSIDALTFTTSLVSASEFHIYVDPGTMTAAKSYELIISKFCVNAAGTALAANTKYDFVTA
jgi:hypothetical protein